ncbi:MAG: glycosyltransferase family 4 protein [Rikenellaceae bacterium]|jgi:glycosyltransferase involved in cell wall biosynthesis|nr:glycosyltransferase family 4 protein [Rikenellaceae bacterium]
MNILYDGTAFARQRAGGVSRYHYELCKRMADEGANSLLASLFTKNRYILSDARLRRKFVRDDKAIFATVNDMIVKLALMCPARYDVFHPTDTEAFMLRALPDNKPMVVTIHDAIVERETGQLLATKGDFARRADRIIAVSQATKDDIVELYGLPQEKIEVIYHGASINDRMVGAKLPALPDKYLLYVGHRGGHKNFEMLVRSIGGVLKRDGLRLVCAGGRPSGEGERAMLRELGVEDNVLMCDRIDDHALASLYAGAAAFVFPSLNEGFGIPILEAWSCHTPVVLSDNRCFREVAGDAGLFFDPLSEGSICEAVERILHDNALAKTLVERGDKRSELFSWERTAQRTANLYRTLL